MAENSKCEFCENSKNTVHSILADKNGKSVKTIWHLQLLYTVYRL